MSTGFPLTHKGNGVFPTIFGLIATIAIVALSIQYCYYDLEDFFAKKPVISTNFKFSGVNSYYTFNSSSLPMYFQLFKLNLNNMKTEAISQEEVLKKSRNANVTIGDVSLLYHSDDGMYGVSNMIKSMQLAKCTNQSFWDPKQYNLSQDYGNSFDYVNNAHRIEEMKQYSICIPNELNYNISNIFKNGTKAYNYASITLNKRFMKDVVQKMYPDEKIGIKFHYQVLSQNFKEKYHDKNKYIRKVWRTEEYYSNPDENNIYRLSVQKTHTEFLKQYFFYHLKEERDNYTIIDIKNTLNLKNKKGENGANDDDTEEVDFTFNIRLTDFISTVDSTSIALSDILGNFFGTFELLQLLVNLVLGFLVTPFYLKSIVNRLFYFHKSENSIEDMKQHLGSLIKKLNEYGSRAGARGMRRDSHQEYYNEKMKTEMEMEMEQNERIDTNKNLIKVNQDDPVGYRSARASGHNLGNGPVEIEMPEIPNSNKPNAINLNKSSTSKDETIEELLVKYRSSIPKPKKLKVSLYDTFRYQCLCCCKKTASDEVLSKAIEKYESCLEVQNIYNSQRELSLLRSVMLNSKQNKLFGIYSENIDFAANEIEEKQGEEEGNDDDSEINSQINEEKYFNEIDDKFDTLAKMDFKDNIRARENRELTINFIKSLL